MSYLLSCVLILFFSCSVLRADCDGEGWELFPDGATLSPQPIIVLDGQFGSATTIDSIRAGTPIYLRSKQHKVQLNVVEFLTGDMGRKQIVLTPKEKLRVGHTYELFIKEPDDEWNYDNYLYRSDPITGEWETAHWKVVKGKDTVPPMWRSEPVVQRKTHDPYRIGIHIPMWVVFKCEVNDASRCIVKAVVRNLTTGRETIYYVLMDSIRHRFDIGCNHCSGAFMFEGGNEFEAVFTPMDAEGNIGTPTAPIVFTKPTEQDAEPREPYEDFLHR